MSSHASPSGLSPNGDGLPPVKPPSAGFILQLFLVPGVLVAGIVAFIWIFFGWIGAGPRTPEQFMGELQSETASRRQKAAADLAQLLPRDEALAGNAQFALDLAGLLDAERKKDPPPVSPKNPQEQAGIDQSIFLAIALGRFQVPVGMPLFQEIMRDPRNERISELGPRLRVRNAVWAVSLLGESLAKFDALPDARKDQMTDALRQEAGPGPERSGRQKWAQEALEYLRYRRQRPDTPREGRPADDPFALARVLQITAESADEMTRKHTALALAQWNEPGTEQVLLDLCAGHREELLTHFENSDQDRGKREIRYNAALALVRRASRAARQDLLLEALDEKKQRDFYAQRQKGMEDYVVLFALQAVGAMKQKDPKLFTENADLVAAVEKLTESPNVKIQVEAKKVLGRGSGASGTTIAGLPKQTLLIVAVGGGVALLLALAVFARWRRHVTPLAPAHGPSPSTRSEGV